jgi:uncharacterized protein YqfA (UPF0365 family)
MDRNIIARRIGTLVNGVEKLIEDASLKVQELYAALADTRRALDVSAPAAQRVMARIQNANAKLAEAQAEVTAAHTELEALGGKLGIRAVATGAWKDSTGALVEEDRATARQAA